MTGEVRPRHILTFVTVLLSCHLSLAGDKPINYCADIALKVLNRPALLDSNVLPIVNDPSCFFEANVSITPLRTNLWDAIESLSPAQQQGSSLSSSGSTNAVSKTVWADSSGRGIRWRRRDTGDELNDRAMGPGKDAGEPSPYRHGVTLFGSDRSKSAQSAQGMHFPGGNNRSDTAHI